MSGASPCKDSAIAVRGQALVESLLLLVVLPLAIAIGQISQLSAMQHELLARVRHAIMRLHFAPEEASDALIAANTRWLLAGDSPPPIRYVWSDAESPSVGSPSIEPPPTDSQPTGSRANASRPLDLGSAESSSLVTGSSASAALKVLSIVEPLGQGELGLSPLPPRKLQATWRLAWTSGIADWVNQDTWTLQESLSLLPDTWVAPNKDVYLSRITAITVAGRLAEISSAVSALSSALGVIEPAFERFCPARYGLDIVPDDRLQNAQIPPNDLRQEPCDVRP